MNVEEITRNNKKIKVITDVDLAIFYEVSVKEVHRAKRYYRNKYKEGFFFIKKGDNLKPSLSKLLDEPAPYYCFSEEVAYLMSFEINSSKAVSFSNEAMDHIISIKKAQILNPRLSHLDFYFKSYEIALCLNRPFTHKVTSVGDILTNLSTFNAETGINVIPALDAMATNLKNEVIREVQKLLSLAPKTYDTLILAPILVWLYRD